jgi:GTP-binding protein
LIEGASSGAGLGHAFLRHVERTRILVHIVDGADRDPEWSYNVIRDELGAHDPALLVKPALVAFNKMDRPAAAEAWPAFRDARLAQGITALAISAEKGSAGIVVHRLESSGNTFTVAREDGILVVHGRKIERLASQTNFDVEESAERFQQDLVRLGVDHELRRQGVAPGETVRIGSSELEWESDAWEDR